MEAAGSWSTQHLDRILEAARRIPSSTNRQRWDFVVRTDRARLERLAKVFHGAWHVAGSVATVALVAPKTDDPRENASIAYDLGQATMGASCPPRPTWASGSGHAAVVDEDLARETLGYPDDRRCAYLIALGYPADRKGFRNP